MPTESSADRTTETLLVLPFATDATTLAAACRDTALAFLRDAGRWGAAELVAWLGGPYAQLTQHHAAYARRQTGEYVHPLPGLRDVDTRMVDRVLRVARAAVNTTLEPMRDPEGGASFAFGMMSAGFVARCKDVHGTSGWAPTSSPQRSPIGSSRCSLPTTSSGAPPTTMASRRALGPNVRVHELPAPNHLALQRAERMTLRSGDGCTPKFGIAPAARRA